MSKIISYNSEKNKKLIAERGVGFEDILKAIENDKLMDRIKHPNKEKYPNQWVLIVNIDDYAYFVPYIETETEIFLKTIYPDRNFTEKYITNEKK